MSPRTASPDVANVPTIDNPPQDPPDKATSTTVPAPDVVVHAMADEGDFMAAGEEAYWRETTCDPYDIDSWSPPVAVRSPAFRRLLQTRWPKLTKRCAKLKDILDACEDAAFSARHVPLVQWARWTGSSLQMVISPRHVVDISAQAVRVLRNGTDAVFTVPNDFDTLSWGDVVANWREDGHTMPRLAAVLTSDLPPPISTDPMQAQHHAAMLTAYWIGTFCVPLTQGRPVLAIIGGYGSGKTATARILGKLYYGKDFDVGGGVGGSRAVKDMVASMNACPFVVRDDMNREPEAIVDTICRVATGSRVELANMHETLAFTSYSLSSNLVVTAHTPTWALRPDVLSRMLVMRIAKPAPPVDGAACLSEVQRYERAVAVRAGVWADTFCAIHKMLQVDARWATSTRFEDWETCVRRAAHAGGYHVALHESLVLLSTQRVNMAQDVEPWLAALVAVARDMAPTDKWFTAAEMYDLVAMRMGGVISEDAMQRPSAAMFRNQRALGKWLGELEREGAAVVDVERGPMRNGVATWRLRPKT